MLAALEAVFTEQSPDWVLVYGDTNSTLAAAVSAVKLHLPVAHLEAGLRSFNRRMPEEHNRVLTDHASDVLLAPTDVAAGHLVREGLGGRTVVVGDVMTDVLYRVRDRLRVEGGNGSNDASLPDGEYYVATIHRAENTDDVARLTWILDGLAALDKPVVLLAHPRLVARAAASGLRLDRGSIVPRPPVAYPELIAAVMSSAGVVTDSGGLQKEAFLLEIPCTTVRTETEWTETVELGWNRLVSSGEQMAESVIRTRPRAATTAPYGDGRAAARALEVLCNWKL